MPKYSSLLTLTAVEATLDNMVGQMVTHGLRLGHQDLVDISLTSSLFVVACYFKITVVLSFPFL